MKIIVSYNSNSFEIEINNSEELINKIEEKLNIDKSLFHYNILNGLSLENDSHVQIIWKYKFFNDKLIHFTFNKKEYLLPENILLESKVVKTIVCEDNDQVSNFEDDKIEFSNNKLNNINSILIWTKLSSEINLHLNTNGQYLSELEIPKPLPNCKVSKYIGENAYDYLNELSLTDIEEFTVFCDYLDISYLLEVLCAFIAEKYVKNKSIEEIKNIFNDI